MNEEKKKQLDELADFLGVELPDLVGEKGEQGIQGIQGEKGEKGDKGERGEPGKNGKDGIDGIDGNDGRDGADGKDGKDGSPDSSEQVRDKLETLKDEERLDISAIKGLDEKLTKNQNGFQLFGGTSGIKLYVNGVKKGTAKTLNLVPGANVSMNYVASNGRNDIIISASLSGGGLTVLPATGAIDGINTSFTFTEKPIYLVIDGGWYRENVGWTWSVLTATLTIPPSNDIYGLK